MADPVANNYGKFTQVPRRLMAVLTAAKTTYGDIANAVSFGTTGPNGSLLVRASAMPRATVAATQQQLYLSDGATHYLIGSALMAAYTMAATTAVPATTILVDGREVTLDQPVALPASAGGVTWTLYGAIGIALAGGVVQSLDVWDF